MAKPITAKIPPHLPKGRASLYEPFQPWQRRLIKLLPGKRGNVPIACELHIAEIINFEGFGLPRESRIQPYEAISQWVKLSGLLLVNHLSLAFSWSYKMWFVKLNIDFSAEKTSQHR